MSENSINELYASGGPIFSSRGRPKLASDGYLYIFDRDAKDGKTKYWRCDQKNHCRARVHTIDGNVVRQVGLHSHDASAATIEAHRLCKLVFFAKVTKL